MVLLRFIARFVKLKVILKNISAAAQITSAAMANEDKLALLTMQYFLRSAWRCNRRSCASTRG